MHRLAWFKPGEFSLDRQCDEGARNPWSPEKTAEELARLGIAEPLSGRSIDGEKDGSSTSGVVAELEQAALPQKAYSVPSWVMVSPFCGA